MSSLQHTPVFAGAGVFQPQRYPCASWIERALEVRTAEREQAPLRKQEIAQGGLRGQRSYRAHVHAVDDGVARFDQPHPRGVRDEPVTIRCVPGEI